MAHHGRLSVYALGCVPKSFLAFTVSPVCFSLLLFSDKPDTQATNKLQTFSRHCTSFQCHLGWSNVTRTLCLWCPQPISSLNSFCNWLQLVCAFRISQSNAKSQNWFLGVQISCLDLIVLKKILVDEGLELKFCNKNISRLKKYYTAFLLP